MTARASLSVVALLLPLAAAATPNFPPYMRDSLQLSTSPDCQICHRGTPKLETVTRPFGVALRERGLQPYSTFSLDTALAAMRQDAVDSDGDGVLDVDELTDETNPNGDAPGPPTPTFGCGGGNGRVIAPFPFGLLWGVRRRRRSER